MKKTVLLLALLTVGTYCLAESSVIAELKALRKSEQEWKTLPGSIERVKEVTAHRTEVMGRVRPIVSQEFAKLVDAEITPLAYELLNDPEASAVARNTLSFQLLTYPVKTQADVLEKVFNATSDALRGRLLLTFIVSLPKEAPFPKEMFAGKEIQEWLVEKINAGLPGGPFYFILTDESADAVSNTAKSSMERFSKGMESGGRNLFSLLSAVFLASHGDKDALKLLDSLLDKRDIDYLLDTGYVIPASAMSGNEKLIQKIRDIITTDTRTRWNGEDAMPEEDSFAHIAASACSLTIEGFPSVGYWGLYDDAMKKQVHGWLKANPTHTIKPDSARIFFRESPFEGIMTDMVGCGWGKKYIRNKNR